ncbi:hypothetical protein Pelo_5965 [Pelomyxa schiedti]|nr:hypothetical protein Pelo_5965 [Pelomyxa schiedti]
MGSSHGTAKAKPLTLPRVSDLAMVAVFPQAEPDPPNDWGPTAPYFNSPGSLCDHLAACVAEGTVVGQGSSSCPAARAPTSAPASAPVCSSTTTTSSSSSSSSPPGSGVKVEVDVGMKAGPVAVAFSNLSASQLCFGVYTYMWSERNPRRIKQLLCMHVVPPRQTMATGHCEFLTKRHDENKAFSPASNENWKTTIMMPRALMKFRPFNESNAQVATLFLCGSKQGQSILHKLPEPVISSTVSLFYKIPASVEETKRVTNEWKSCVVDIESYIEIVVHPAQGEIYLASMGDSMRSADGAWADTSKTLASFCFTLRSCGTKGN